MWIITLRSSRYARTHHVAPVTSVTPAATTASAAAFATAASTNTHNPGARRSCLPAQRGGPRQPQSLPALLSPMPASGRLQVALDGRPPKEPATGSQCRRKNIDALLVQEPRHPNIIKRVFVNSTLPPLARTAEGISP